MFIVFAVGCGGPARELVPPPTVTVTQADSLLDQMEKQTPQSFPGFAAAHADELNVIYNQNPPTTESKKCQELAQRFSAEIRSQIAAK